MRGPHLRIPLIPDVPPEVSRPLLREIRACERYLPHWLRTLTLQYITAADAVQQRACEIVTQPAYYTATLRIMPRWLDLDGADRHKSIVHEIGHLHHADAYHAAIDAVDALATDAARDYLRANIREQFERSAESFCQMVLGLEGRA